MALKDYLRYIEFFNRFSEQELEEFSEVADVVTTKPNQFILKEGEEGKGLFFIVDGEVLVLKKIKDNTYKRLKKLEVGEFFGEMSLLTDEKNSAYVVSKDRATLIFISKDVFFKLMEDNPKLALRIVRSLAEALSNRLRYLNQKYEMLLAQCSEK